MDTAISAVLDGWGVVKADNEMIRFGTTIKAFVNEFDEDGKKVKSSIEKATGSKLQYGEIEVVVSNDKIDRYNESILVDGIDLAQIKRNPTVLWGHDYDGLPIGKITKIWKQEGNLMARMKLSVEKYDFARQVYDLILDGAINAVSLGGMVKKWSDDMLTIEKLELYEISVVPVPAHRDALIVNRSFTKDNAFKMRKSYQDFVQDAVMEKAKGFSKDALYQHIQALKSLTLALEASHGVSADTNEDDAQSKGRVRQLVVLRQNAKGIDKVAELIISQLNNKLKETI